MTAVRRRTEARGDTWDALVGLVQDQETQRVTASNRQVQWALSSMGVKVTLPAVTARLQSLQEIGAIDINYWLNPEGHSIRTIYLLEAPERPRPNGRTPERHDPNDPEAVPPVD
jgi:hypothetical protein